MHMTDVTYEGVEGDAVGTVRGVRERRGQGEATGCIFMRQEPGTELGRSQKRIFNCIHYR